MIKVDGCPIVPSRLMEIGFLLALFGVSQVDGV